MLNHKELTARRLQHEADRKGIASRIEAAKNDGSVKALNNVMLEYTDWKMEKEFLEDQEKQLRTSEISLKMNGTGSSATGLSAQEMVDTSAPFRAAIDNGKRLHFGDATAKSLATKTAVATNGAAVVGQEFRADPIALGKPATGLLDVLPVIPHGSPDYAYMRQSLRTNNAAVVADGSQKPTSEFAVTRITNALSVIAHLTEAVNTYWMQDNANLASWLQGELQYGLNKAVESTTLTAITGTSGIQTQSFSTSIPVTLRKSMTKLEILGYVPKAIVLHPSDFESIELALSTTNAVEHLSLPYEPASRRLYGVPIATTVAQSVGQGLVIASGAVAIDTDNLGIQLRWSDQGADSAGNDMFSYNEQRARLEGRYGTSVYLPAGVVVATLA